MHGCSARLFMFSAALVLAVGILAWSINTITTSVSSLFPSEADNQAISLALQRQELALAQERADWERGQAEANALLPALVLTKTALLLLGVIAVAGLLAIAADIYLRHRRKEQAHQARYLLIDGQAWLLTPLAQHGKSAPLMPAGSPPVPTAPARRQWEQQPPLNLNGVWTDNPAQYEAGDEISGHARGHGWSSTHPIGD